MHGQSRRARKKTDAMRGERFPACGLNPIPNERPDQQESTGDAEIDQRL